MHIVLVEWRPSRSIENWNSLGLQYIAAALRKNSHRAEVKIFEGETVENTVKTILSLNPAILGVQLYRETDVQIYSIIKKVKEARRDMFIVAGGHTATLYAAQIMQKQPGIDAVVCGEGERTTAELCRRLQEKRDLRGCKGIFFRENGMVHRTPPGELIKDLDTLAFPSIGTVPNKGHESGGPLFISISTSRGCLGTCDFCVEHRTSRAKGSIRWRGRTPGNIVSELEYYKKKFPGKQLVIHFLDGSFEDPDPGEKSRLQELIDLFENRGIQAAFSFLTRSDSWGEKDDALIKRMKKNGLFRVSIGLESGSRKDLSIFGKKARLEDNYRVCELFSRNHIAIFGFMIMFHPYTTFTDLRDNITFLKTVNLAHRPEVWCHDMYVYPDTMIFRRLTADGLLLGPEQGGYYYLYAFEDGRMEKLHRQLQKIKNLRSLRKFQATYDKISLEISLYKIWKERLPRLKKVREDMDSYQEKIENISKEVGIHQCDYFSQLVTAAEKGNLEIMQTQITKNWDNLLSDKQARMEKLWMQNYMHLARNKLRII
jgi:radical SAM superfamily enzyme YgiQ (UPF0313 family)